MQAKLQDTSDEQKLWNTTFSTFPEQYNLIHDLNFE